MAYFGTEPALSIGRMNDTPNKESERMTETAYYISKNPTYGDYRIEQHVDGAWDNETDNNWTEGEAKQVLKAIEAGEVDFLHASGEIDGRAV